MQLAKTIIDDFHLDFMGYLKNSSITTFSEYVKEIVSLPELGNILRGQSHCSHYELADSSIDEFYILIKRQYSTCFHEDYMQKVRCLSPLMHHISSAMWRVDPNSHIAVNKEYLKWLCVNCDDVSNCLQDAQTKRRGQLVSASLRLTSVLERSLQDLLWTIDGKTPIVLKEVLHSNTLTNVVGEELTSFLDVIVGPPTSLNIRNLLWHGFGSADEQPELFVMVIYIVLILIGRQLNDKGIEVSHRPYISIDTEFLTSHSATANAVSFEQFETFISAVSVKSEEMSQALVYAKDSKYGLAVMLLLPSFEHIARVAYCVCNRCPDRLMTAVSSEYFTTLDNVFEETLGDGISPNRLHQMLPDRLRMALCDLLYHPKGWRLRDKLSHMEICYKSISKEIWCFCFQVLSTTILLLARGQDFTVTEEHFLRSYEPLYHPLAFTLRTVTAIGKDLFLLNSISCPDGIDAGAPVADLEPACHVLSGHFRTKLHSLSYDDCPGITDLLLPSEHNSSPNLSTSSGFKPVAEWCRLLHLVANNSQTALKCILTFSCDREKMLQDRKLRARQRKNFMMFHNYKPCLAKMFRTLHAVIVKLIQDIAVAYNCVVKKEHRSLLQLSENISTLINENKWANTVAYFQTFVASHF